MLLREGGIAARLSLAVLASWGLAACAHAWGPDTDRIRLSKFEPTGPDSFRFEASADSYYYPLDDGGERARLGWLREYLRQNHLCADGYEITDRTEAVVQVGSYWTVYYEGRCT